jgi:hypothetical protein
MKVGGNRQPRASKLIARFSCHFTSAVVACHTTPACRPRAPQGLGVFEDDLRQEAHKAVKGSKTVVKTVVKTGVKTGVKTVVKTVAKTVVKTVARG